MIEYLHQTYNSPIGLLQLTASKTHLISLSFEPHATTTENASIKNTVLEQCIQQLDAYFTKELREFTIPLQPEGTPFQVQVWNYIQKIPYGTTITYLQQAKAMQHEKAIRAIASANGKNPIPIIIPCHRIIGSNGTLSGYSGGIHNKSWLLSHEGSMLL